MLFFCRFLVGALSICSLATAFPYDQYPKADSVEPDLVPRARTRPIRRVRPPNIELRIRFRIDPRTKNSHEELMDRITKDLNANGIQHQKIWLDASYLGDSVPADSSLSGFGAMALGSRGPSTAESPDSHSAAAGSSSPGKSKPQTPPQTLVPRAKTPHVHTSPPSTSLGVLGEGNQRSNPVPGVSFEVKINPRDGKPDPFAGEHIRKMLSELGAVNPIMKCISHAAYSDSNLSQTGFNQRKLLVRGREGRKNGKKNEQKTPSPTSALPLAESAVPTDGNPSPGPADGNGASSIDCTGWAVVEQGDASSDLPRRFQKAVKIKKGKDFNPADVTVGPLIQPVPETERQAVPRSRQPAGTADLRAGHVGAGSSRGRPHEAGSSGFGATSSTVSSHAISNEAGGWASDSTNDALSWSDVGAEAAHSDSDWESVNDWHSAHSGSSGGGGSTVVSHPPKISRRGKESRRPSRIAAKALRAGRASATASLPSPASVVPAVPTAQTSDFHITRLNVGDKVRIEFRGVKFDPVTGMPRPEDVEEIRRVGAEMGLGLHNLRIGPDERPLYKDPEHFKTSLAAGSSSAGSSSAGSSGAGSSVAGLLNTGGSHNAGSSNPPSSQLKLSRRGKKSRRPSRQGRPSRKEQEEARSTLPSVPSQTIGPVASTNAASTTGNVPFMAVRIEVDQKTGRPPPGALEHLQSAVGKIGGTLKLVADDGSLQDPDLEPARQHDHSTWDMDAGSSSPGASTSGLTSGAGPSGSNIGAGLSRPGGSGSLRLASPTAGSRLSAPSKFSRSGSGSAKPPPNERSLHARTSPPSVWNPLPPGSPPFSPPVSPPFSQPPRRLIAPNPLPANILPPTPH